MPTNYKVVVHSIIQTPENVLTEHLLSAYYIWDGNLVICILYMGWQSSKTLDYSLVL